MIPNKHIFILFYAIKMCKKNIFTEFTDSKIFGCF